MPGYYSFSQPMPSDPASSVLPSLPAFLSSPAARCGHHGGQHPDHADLPADVHQRRNGHPDGRDLLAHRVPVLHGHHGHPGI